MDKQKDKTRHGYYEEYKKRHVEETQEAQRLMSNKSYLDAQTAVTSALRAHNMTEVMISPMTHDIVMNPVYYEECGAPRFLCFFTCRTDENVEPMMIYFLPKRKLDA